jgi:UDP-N-acetylmuramoylalanine--D-glutamate ligase
MDRYDSLESYAAVKQRIFLDAENQVFNRRDTLTRPATSAPSQVTQWSFGLDAAADHAVGISDKQEDAFFSIANAEPLMRVNDVFLPGRHNLENVAAALAVVLAAGWPVDKCVQAVTCFTGLPHRCEWVAEIGGVRFYNDSKGTNVGATVAAIAGLAGANKNIVLIAGGDGKGADFSALADSVHQHVKHLVLIGRDANRIAEACHLSAVTFVSSMQLAVQQAAEIAEAGEVVLLSPACASFDMFAGYEDRGRQFCLAVELLA